MARSRIRIGTFILLLALSVPGHTEGTLLQLSFSGDVMVHTANYLTTDYSAIYRSVAPLFKKDDLSFANLEFPVDPSSPFSSYPRFNGTPEYLQAAVEAGIDVFSLANNHAFDQGRDGILQTLRCLSRIGEQSHRRLYAGGIRGNLKVPFQPVEIHCRGIRIGFLAVCQMVNRPMPDFYVNIVDYRNRRHREYFLPYIEAVAPQYDLFILSYHGGREYSREPEEEANRFFDRLLEAGVDVVWAHHPHVVQPHRLVDREEGRALIMPSTGNLISGMLIGLEPQQPEHKFAWTTDSAVWLVTVLVESGQASVQRVAPLPITNYRNGRGDVLVERMPGMGGKKLPAEWQSYYRERARLLRVSLRATGEEHPIAIELESDRLALISR
ncbi:MAG: CapA family protein [Spirochaetaceae bacterium]|nr:MAG: CapA family protein [Spirochaetaceae bacterium]